MADNTVINAGSGGDTISTDDVGSGVKVQRVKAQWGPDGTGTDVDVAAGLPVQSGWKELTGSASANNTDLVSADVSGYRWVSVHVTGTLSATLSFQQSNDNTNWVSVALIQVSTATPTIAISTAATGTMWAGALTSRYFRVRTTAYTSGTPAVVVELAAAPSGWLIANPTSTVNVAQASGGGFGDGFTSGNGFASELMGYNPSTSGWERIRVPAIIKTATTTASGATTVWTPTTGKKFRLMRYKLSVTQDASTSGGADITLTFVDSASNTAIVETVFVPASAATTMGPGWTSGWVDLANGFLSSTNNNVLNISLSAALTSGAVRVLVAGNEE